MYTRLLKFPLENSASFFLFGPRGTGKTTWLKQSLGNSALFIDLLDARYYTMLSADPTRLEGIILSTLKKWVVIDEIQKLPTLLDEIHRLIESKGVKFILTGSSARKLRKEGVNLLAGRARTYHLYPLTAIELGSDFSIESALRFGQLPEVQKIRDKSEFLESYIGTYLREEVLQEGLTRNLGNFSRFLETASFSQGSVLNMSEVARDAAISQKQSEQYFQILEDLLIAYRLPVFSKKAKRRLIAHPKFYYFDVGIYNAIRPTGPLEQGAESEGALLETLCLQELIAINHYYRGQYQLYFWRTSHSTEVDFVLYGPNGLIAIEVKRSKRIHNKDLKGLNAFKKDYPMATLYCFYGGKISEKIEDIHIIPVENALKKLNQLLLLQ